jgi:hypothetical protein
MTVVRAASSARGRSVSQQRGRGARHRLSYDVVVVVSELRKEWLVPSGNATIEHSCHSSSAIVSI